MRLLVAALLLTALALPARAAPPAPWANGGSAPEDLRVSLLTFGPGDDVASWFGHSAILVEDTRRLENRVYNYGMFSFDRALLVRYALGRLSFWVGSTSLERTLATYRAQNRDIKAQILKLAPVQRAELAAFLEDNVLPDKRSYLYHHFKDNCATRPRDAIDRVVDGALRRLGRAPARMTLRDHVRRYASSAALGLLLDFAMNDEIEHPIAAWDEAFLPAELSAQVAAAGLVEGEVLLHTATARPPTPPTPPRHALVLLLLGALLGGAAVGLAHLGRHSAGWVRVLGVHQALVGAVVGGPGLALALMWAVTEHTVTYANENLLLANPVSFAALPLGLALLVRPAVDGRAARWLRVAWLSLAMTSAFAVVAKLLPLFDQDNAPLLALLVPLNVGCALAFARLTRR